MVCKSLEALPCELQNVIAGLLPGEDLFRLGHASPNFKPFSRTMYSVAVSSGLKSRLFSLLWPTPDVTILVAATPPRHRQDLLNLLQLAFRCGCAVSLRPSNTAALHSSLQLLPPNARVAKFNIVASSEQHTILLLLGSSQLRVSCLALTGCWSVSNEELLSCSLACLTNVSTAVVDTALTLRVWEALTCLRGLCHLQVNEYCDEFPLEVLAQLDVCVPSVGFSIWEGFFQCWFDRLVGLLPSLAVKEIQFSVDRQLLTRLDDFMGANEAEIKKGGWKVERRLVKKDGEFVWKRFSHNFMEQASQHDSQRIKVS